MPSKIKAKTLKTAPKDKQKPWLRLPARPAGSDEQRVRMYMPDEVVELSANVREMPRSLALDEAGTITIDVADPAGDLASLELLDADEDMLLDGIDIRWGMVWWRIARLERTDDGWSITAEDQVAALVRSHRRAMRASRDDMTRAAFAYQLVSSVKFGGGIASYIPELNDKQKIQKAEKPDDKVSGWTAEKATAKSSGSSYGWGKSASKVKVKRQTANGTQLKCINLVLAEAAKLGASRRVMIAVVMTITQETTAGVTVGGNSIAPDVRGPFQQRTFAQSGWTTSVKSALDPTASCRRYLTGGDRGAPGWKQKHGSLHSASGNLGEMIDAIQVAGTPSAFGQWESEATKTVDVWLDRNEGATSTSSPTTKTEYYRGVFQFKTSDSDENANWWDATGQLATDVKWHRWAAANVFCFASDDELIRGNPVLFMSRDEDWVQNLKWTWDVRREAAALTVVVQLEDEWQVLPGMVVMVDDDDAAVEGRWIIDKIDDTPIGTDVTTQLTCRRRNAKAIEPAAEIRQKTVKVKADKQGKSYGGGGGSSSTQDPNSHGLVYPASKHGTDGGGPAAHGARAWGNWQSDNAVDILLPRGTAIFAVADGTITKLGGAWRGGSGNPDGFNVTLHTSGNDWFYTHLQSRESLRVGMRVKAGQLLGHSGAANGVNHLHIGCRSGDPEALLGVRRTTSKGLIV